MKCARCNGSGIDPEKGYECCHRADECMADNPACIGLQPVEISCMACGGYGDTDNLPPEESHA